MIYGSCNVDPRSDYVFKHKPLKIFPQNVSIF